VARDGEDVAANEVTAIWRKPKAELTSEQTTEFYRHVAHAFDEPWATLHWRAEGALEFIAMLFVPGARPFEPLEQQRESRIRLHVRRMFITDDAELLPPFLRFVRGVVDTEDLPLNVSREMLQATPVLARIRKAVTGRVLSELKTRAKDGEDYAKFWENFGPTLKEGIWEDAEYRTEVAALSRFKSSSVDGWTTLAEYIGRMRPEQDAIYYLTGDNPAALATSPQLEGFRARGLEVLLLADAVDAFWPDRLYQFEDKKLRSVTQGLSDLSKHPVENVDEGEAADIGDLVTAIKAALGDAVTDVKASDRLVGSAVVLGAAGGGPDLQMQRLLRRSGQTLPPSPPVLELNPRHALVRSLAERLGRGESVDEPAHLLLDLARIQDGEPPAEPALFARRMADALAASFGGA
jgi:molecular chaperone HtpG